MGKQKSKRVKPRLLKGMQDGWPVLAAARRAAMASVEGVCRNFGFLPFDTPALEAAATLFGRDPDPEQLTGNFVFTDNDEELVALRYEHTAPLARVVSQYRNEIALPFRRYTMGPVWRFDKPEPGRFREFLQLDVDIVGAPGMVADAEIMALMYRRIDQVVRDMSTVGEEFNEGPAEDILGELADLLDVGQILEEATDAGILRTRERIDEALQRARESLAK